MGSKTNGADNQYQMFAPVTGATESTRLSLTTASATNTRVLSGKRYWLRLSSLSTGSAFCKFAASASLPASDAALTAGFWIDPGETVAALADAATLSAILTAGTGELLITRQAA